MPRTIEGRYDGSGRRFAIVAGRFNDRITGSLVDGATSALRRHGVADDDVTLAWVPGAFEIPLVAQRLAKTGRFDAIIAVGAVIRGATSHYDLVAGECAAGCARVSIETGVPVLFGVLTTDTVEQAIERAGTKSGNKGFDAALAALETTDVLARVREVE